MRYTNVVRGPTPCETLENHAADHVPPGELMNRGRHEGLRNKAKQRFLLQKMSTSLQVQLKAWERQKIPALVHPAPEIALHELERMVGHLNRDMENLMDGSPISLFVDSVRGLGTAVFFLCGLLPPLDQFPNAAKVWKYLGLHVDGGSAPRRTRGEFLGWSPELKSIALIYIGEPMIRARGPYRKIYDERRASMEARFPDRTKYFHADARRVMTKAIVADIWAVWNGKTPRGGHPSPETHDAHVPAGAL